MRRRGASVQDVSWHACGGVICVCPRSSDAAARFLRQEPGFTVVRASEFDRRGPWVRFTIEVLDVSGAKVNEGWDIVVLDSEGRIARVVNFWGRLSARQARLKIDA